MNGTFTALKALNVPFTANDRSPPLLCPSRWPSRTCRPQAPDGSSIGGDIGTRWGQYVSTRHINPEGLSRNPAFSQAVVVEQPSKTIYIGGQNGVDAEGKVVGDTAGEQAAQALRNIVTILESEGASLANIVHWRIAVVDGHGLNEGFAAFQQAWNPADAPPAITVHVVAGLIPGFLVEIDAVAVV